MTHTTRTLVALVTLAVLAAAVAGGCGGTTDAQSSSPPPSAPPGAADITGVIRDLAPGADAGTVTLLVVADSAVAGAYDKASVRLTGETTIWAPAGEGRTLLAVEDLVAGQQVAVWFTGPVAESYPVQAAAGWLEVLTPLE